jgi:hypothetical protein
MTGAMTVWQGPAWPSATAGFPAASGAREGLEVVADVSTRCGSVEAAAQIDIPFPTYEMTRNSGCLRFWDEPEEDLYTFDDGEGIRG